MKALKTSSLVIALSLGTLGVTAVASAHGHGARGARLFEQVDTNKNGEITKAEMRKAVDERFTKVDTNKDNFVTPEEMKAAREAMRQAHHQNRKPAADSTSDKAKGERPAHKNRHGSHMMEKIDTNKDGKVSRAEAYAVADAFFQRLDQDKNQVISQKEAAEARSHRGHRSGGAKKSGTGAPEQKTK